MPRLSGLSNIQSIMEKRKNEQAHDNNAKDVRVIHETYSSKTEDIIPVEFVENTSSSEELYSNIFETKAGARIRTRYEENNMPRVHKLLYDAIRNEIGNEKEKHIILQPILDVLDILRSQCILILSCLEHYGYLKITRLPGTGRPLSFKLLK